MKRFGRARKRFVFGLMLIVFLGLGSTGLSQMAPPGPAGKGMWIWYLNQADGGDLAQIVSRLQDARVDWIALKCGDGTVFWSDQCTRQIIDAFHRGGLMVYGWQFVYGDDPIGEAVVANRALDLGIDGFIIDAEGQYEGKPESALRYLQAIRRSHATGFLAYAPFPIISYHRDFPYLEFGRYCNAVMPQAYWQAIGVTPERMVAWMEAEWASWAEVWQAEGHADSIKPIIPIGQGWDVAPGEISAFSDLLSAKGYRAVSLWVYNTMTPPMWAAYQEAFDGSF